MSTAENSTGTPASTGTRPASARAGISWMLVTTLLFVSQDAVTRVLLQSYPVAEVAWARFAGHTLIALLTIGVFVPRLTLSRRPGLQLVRSGLLLMVTVFAMLSFRVLPFVDVSAVVNATPVLVTLLSIPLLKETVGWRRALAVATGFAGALLIVGPASALFQWAVAFPLVAVFANALYQISTRVLRTADPPLTTFFYTSVVGTLLCSAAVPFVWTTPDAAGWARMLLLGALGAASHYCLIRAFTAAPAATVAPFAYSTMVWAALFGLVLFGEVPSMTTIAGGAIIIASGIYILYRERVVARSSQ